MGGGTKTCSRREVPGRGDQQEGSGPTIIRRHWEKPGTIEQLHDDTKNGYAAGHMPCGEFGANAAWYGLNLLAYNVGSVLRHRLLPPEFQNAKPKRVRFLVCNILAMLTTHGRYLTARIADWVVRRCGLFALRGVLRRLLLATRHDPLPAPAG